MTEPALTRQEQKEQTHEALLDAALALSLDEGFAQISIRYEEGNEQMPAIPSKAIIFDKNKNFVMVYKDKCNIETREVELFKTIGDTTYIRSGLAAGEKVISQYQLLVYDALND